MSVSAAPARARRAFAREAEICWAFWAVLTERRSGLIPAEMTSADASAFRSCLTAAGGDIVEVCDRIERAFDGAADEVDVTPDHVQRNWRSLGGVA